MPGATIKVSSRRAGSKGVPSAMIEDPVDERPGQQRAERDDREPQKQPLKRDHVERDGGELAGERREGVMPGTTPESRLKSSLSKVVPSATIERSLRAALTKMMLRAALASALQPRPELTSSPL